MVELSLRDTFGSYLVELGKNNNDIIVLDADLSSSTRTFKFAKAFPNRFFNMGVAEQNMLGAALGFAISGKIPVVSGFSIFTTGRAWEFIRFAAHDNLNYKIITTHGGLVGEDGSTHNSLEDISLMATLPNMNILIPSDNIELVEILKHTFESEGPFYVRLPRGSFPKIHDDTYKFHLGKPDIIKESFVLDFNFHRDISDNEKDKKIEIIKNFIKKLPNYFNKANEISNGFFQL